MGGDREDRPPLENVKTEVLQGKRVGVDACSFDRSIDVEADALPPGRVAEQRMVQVDYAACLATIQSGTRPAMPEEMVEPVAESGHVMVPALREETVEITREGAPVEQGEPADTTPGMFAPGHVAPRLVSRKSSAYAKFLWEDPPNIDVSSVRVSVAWAHNGQCTGRLGGRTLYGWFQQSGWTRQSHSAAKGGNCYAQSQFGSAVFKNIPFCKAIVGPFAADTYNVYDDMQIIGFPDGDYSLDFTQWYASGGCANLLSSDIIHGYNYHNVRK